jgi:nucleoside 2-deoxyribosyltransferase
MKTVYLAGPIAGCTENEAKDWREGVSQRLLRHNIMGISPLRCEPAVNGKYDVVSSGDPRFGTAQAIGSKNEFDARNCDMILAYLPTKSIGTVIELGWGKALNIPVILVTQEPYLSVHPVIQHCASWTLKTLEEAEDVIIGVLGDYAK